MTRRKKFNIYRGVEFVGTVELEPTAKALDRFKEENPDLELELYAEDHKEI